MIVYAQSANLPPGAWFCRKHTSYVETMLFLWYNPFDKLEVCIERQHGMFEITYKGLFIFITLAWIVTRAVCGIKNRKADWKYEAKLLTVYICLVVIARIVYFPMRLVEGRIASLVLDVDKIFPLWMNLIPIVHLFDVYDGWLINIIGNVTMFIPVGLAWPFCFKQLDTLGKTVLVGAGFPLFIEITQLPFYDRCSDVDDIILNTTGILIGALIYFGVKRLNTRKKRVS